MSTPSRKLSGKNVPLPDSRRTSQSSSAAPSSSSRQVNMPSQQMTVSRRSKNPSAPNTGNTPPSGNRGSNQTSQHASHVSSTGHTPSSRPASGSLQEMAISRRGPPATRDRATSVALRSSAAQNMTLTGRGQQQPGQTPRTPLHSMQDAPTRRLTPGAERQVSRRLFSDGPGSGDAGSSLGSAVLNAGSTASPVSNSRRPEAQSPFHTPSTLSRQPQRHSSSAQDQDLYRRMENLELGQHRIADEQRKLASDAAGRLDALESDTRILHTATKDIARRTGELSDISRQNTLLLHQNSALIKDHERWVQSQSPSPAVPLAGQLKLNQGASPNAPNSAYVSSSGRQSSYAPSTAGGVSLQSRDFRRYAAAPQMPGAYTSPTSAPGSGGLVASPNAPYGAHDYGPNFQSRSPRRITTNPAAQQSPRGYAGTPTRASGGGGPASLQRQGQQLSPYDGSQGANVVPENKQKTIKDALILQSDITEKLAAKFYTKKIDGSSNSHATQFLIHLMQTHIGNPRWAHELIDHPQYQRIILLGMLNRGIVNNIFEKPLLEEFQAPDSAAFRRHREEEKRWRHQANTRERANAARRRAQIALNIKSTPGFWTWLDMISQSRAEEIERILAPVTEHRGDVDYYRSELLKVVKGYVRLKARLEETPSIFEAMNIQFGADIDPTSMVYRNPTVDLGSFNLRDYPSVSLSTTNPGWNECIYTDTGLGYEYRQVTKAEVLMGPKKKFGPPVTIPPPLPNPFGRPQPRC